MRNRSCVRLLDAPGVLWEGAADVEPNRNADLVVAHFPLRRPPGLRDESKAVSPEAAFFVVRNADSRDETQESPDE
jgi:hypothetical protein